MRTSILRNFPKALLAALCFFSISSIIFGQDSSGAGPGTPQVIPGGNPIPMIALPGDFPFRLVQPPAVLSLYEATSTFNITYLSGGTDYFNDTCTAWPAQAQAAFNYAAGVWATYLRSSVPITINACWATNLASGVLGQSGARNWYRDFSGAPAASTWYTVALANALHGSDLDPANPDMDIAYSSTYNWYFGTDGNPGSGEYDFVSVIMHEIAHGLGFSGLMSVSNSVGSWGSGSGFPAAYDRFTENGSGQALINTSNFLNPSAALATQLTSSNIYFDGTNANAANGGTRPKLYAPATWDSGSSYSHLDYNTYIGTVNALMIYAISAAEARHVPGPVTLGILQDLGWSTASSCTYSISPSSASISSNGGTGSVSVTSQSSCSWTATSNASWITVTSGDSGTGNGTVGYTVASNNGSSSRTGTLTIAGQTFSVTQQAFQNPTPVLTSLSPSSVAAGGLAFALTVNGTGFVSTSTVQWNSLSRTTTFVSGTQLTATIAASDIAAAGTARVTVVNPSPGGGTSNGLTFTINYPVPSAPANLWATSGSSLITLNWTASTGAASYTVYRGTSSGGEVSYASSITATSYQDASVISGTTYYYTVTAISSGGSSGLSMEVSAFSIPSGTTNLALGKPATQSSTVLGATADRVVDGNTDGNWADSSVAHTNAEAQPWWQVDLQSVQSIQSIWVFNRTDCCSERLSAFYVFVSDVAFVSTDLTTTLNQSGVSGFYTSGEGGSPTAITVNRTGRYVRVQLTGSNYLSLAEVQVWSSSSGQTNLALGKPATQSSTVLGATADRAVDGNTSGNWADGSLTHTNAEAQPWWQVDLQTVQSIQTIQVWNRTDCCSERLSAFYVFVSDVPFVSTDLTTTLNQSGVSAFYTSGQGGSPTTITVNRTGRYVRIQLTGSNYLSLAEVQVWASSSGQTNLASGKPATQSSTVLGATADRAVDGNTSGNWADGSVTHTNAEAQPWWQVDLQTVQSIQTIQVWNRTDCCSERLSAFYILVSDAPFVSTDLTTTLNQSGVSGFYIAGQGGSPTTTTVSRTGRYVRVQLTGSNYLSLAEVQIWSPGN